MMQTIAGKTVYVVEFDTMPELPITGLTEEESEYRMFLGRMFGNLNGLLADFTMRNESKYAEALTDAIETGVITEPGKYGIHIDQQNNRWDVYKIVE